MMTFTKTQYNIIQLHAVMLLLGYWFAHSLVTLIIGESSRTISVSYNGIQLMFSFYVMLICRKDFKIEKKRYFLFIYSCLLALYSIRMVYDMFYGPFTSVLPRSVFWADILNVVFHSFVGAWAMIVSRKYLDINKIAKLTYWTGFFIILATIITLNLQGLTDIYEEERLDQGGGLGTLALVKIGAIEVISALHMLLNAKKFRIIYLIGLILGLWMTLASGSRGGFVGLVIALLVYWLLSSTKNLFFTIVAICGVGYVLLNIETIILWIGDYFPIISRRMLLTLNESDEGNRELIREWAFDRIRENPLLGYSYRLKADLSGYGPHNGILDFVLALGIPIGFVYAMTVYVRGLIIAFRMMRNLSLFFPTVMGIFVLVVSMTGNSYNTVFCFSIVLLVASYYYKRH